MIGLSKKYLPDTITVDGREFAIHTEHFFWLCFAAVISKNGATLDEVDFIYNGEPPRDRRAGFTELLKFYNPAQPLPRNTGGNGSRCIDFVQDEDLIYSAFYELYGIDLKERPLHWHKFLSLFRGLHGTKLNDVMAFRSYDETDKDDYKTYMRRMRNAWALNTETEEDKEITEKFNSVFTEA